MVFRKREQPPLEGKQDSQETGRLLQTVLLSPAKTLQLPPSTSHGINSTEKEENNFLLPEKWLACYPCQARLRASLRTGYDQKAAGIAMGRWAAARLLWAKAEVTQHACAQDQFKSGHKIQFMKITF